MLPSNVILIRTQKQFFFYETNQWPSIPDFLSFQDSERIPSQQRRWRWQFQGSGAVGGRDKPVAPSAPRLSGCPHAPPVQGRQQGPPQQHAPLQPGWGKMCPAVEVV